MSKKRKSTTPEPSNAEQNHPPPPTTPVPLNTGQKPVVTEQNAPPLTVPKILVSRPVLGMSLMRMKGSYSLEALAKSKKRNEYFKELAKLQCDMAKLSASDFFQRYPHSGGNLEKLAKEKQAILKQAKEEAAQILGYPLFDNDEYEFMHIHSRPNGTKGTFTLFGFQYENIFEVLLIDPEHEICNT